MRKKWTPLKKGDTVEVVAPSGGNFTAESLQQSALFLAHLDLYSKIQFDCQKTSKGLIEQGLDPFCANTDAYRAEHFYNACIAQDTQALWCMRGGYGAARIIPLLKKLPPPPHPKVLIGLSDITALHIFAQQEWGWPTLHAKCLYQMIHEEANPSHQATLDVLFGQSRLEYELTPLNAAASRTLTLTGSLTGGNLSLVQNSIGTAWQIDTQNKFLFLEDTGERGYKLDRVLEHLDQSHILEHAEALIFGDFILGEEANGQDYSQYAFRRFSEKLAIPVLSLKNIGHGLISYPLPLGTPATLSLGSETQLVCESGSTFGLPQHGF